MTLDELTAARSAKQAEIAELTARIDALRKQTLVKCSNNNYGKGCGQALEIGELEYLQTHWYESPHGCMGGDTWHSDEGQFDCPHCGHRNRLYNRPEIEKLKHLFASVKDVYDK